MRKATRCYETEIIEDVDETSGGRCHVVIMVVNSAAGAKGLSLRSRRCKGVGYIAIFFLGTESLFFLDIARAKT